MLKITAVIRRYAYQCLLAGMRWYCTVLRQLPKRGNRKCVVKKTKPQVADGHLFRQAMGDVVPLKTRPTTDSKLPPAKKRRQEPGYVPAPLTRVSRQATQEQAPVDENNGSSHRKNGVQKKIMQKLKRGHFPIGGQLDLHNMTTQTAHMVLHEFIADAQNRSFECVRIIHGKGLRSENAPKLKLMARQVLRDHPQVLAFTACKPAHGGDGAVDVLLKLRNL
jgi:DNA-nicking Smr family endonuclease